VSGHDARRDRHILLELDALLGWIEQLAASGDRRRYDEDEQYRWVIHRLWIAVGNEADAYAALLGDRAADPWGPLRQLRNRLAHARLPDIDEDEVWRMTTVRVASLREHVRRSLA